MTTKIDWSVFSDTAMVLAAGFGVRMRPLTLTTPKPLLEVGGRTMLDRALDHLKDAGFRRAIVNGHYLADQIESHIKQRHDLDLVFSYETEILETGGGVKKARPLLDGKPVFVVSSDLPWLDGESPALGRLAAFWDPHKMDVLLLVFPLDQANGFGAARGDFMREADGRLWRINAPDDKPYVFIAAMIVKPSLYDEVSETCFSNNEIFNRAEARGRLYGLVHDGACYHVGTPDDWTEANRRLASGEGWG